jgi:hypothetical protein
LHSLTILFRPPNTFKLFGFQIFRYWAYLMKVIPEMRVGRTNFDIYVLNYTNSLGRVWRYQRSNQNPYNEEEQTTEWWKEKVQLSTKHTNKTKDRVTRSSLKTGGELMCSERVSSSCSTNDTRRVNLITNPVLNHECVSILQAMPLFFYHWNLQFLNIVIIIQTKVLLPKA